MTQATLIREFLQNEGSTIVSVEFIKKNGEIRTITFNPLDRNEIKGFGSTNSNPDIIRVRDMNIARTQKTGAWRSFNVNSVRRIRSRGRSYSF